MYITSWKTILADLIFILVDSSPFWIMELCLWIYYHFLFLASITSSVIAGGVAFWYLPSTIKEKISCSFGSFRTTTIDLGRMVARWLGRISNFSAQYIRRLGTRERPSSQKTLFKHQPILKDFRILKLHRKSPTGNIRCSMKDVFLRDAIQFEAISYTWGDATATHTIQIDDSYYVLSGNAYNALSSLASATCSKYVWMDSVCIDQSNNEEKNQQILIMEEIYSRATCVVVWLGDSDDYHLAFELQQELMYFIQTLTMTELYVKYSPQTSTPKWQALNKLLRSPWFDRIWVVQEIGVASRARVHYGSEVMEWEEFQRNFFPEFLDIGPAQLCTFLVPHFNKDKVRDATEIHHAKTMDIIKQAIIKKEKKSLFACLELCMSFQATDPKDLVFALQAISEEGFTTLIPDYNKSVDDVFTEATHAILSSTQNRLSVLSLAGTGFPRDMTNLPSWVPEWGSGDRTTSLTNSGNRKAARPYDYRAGINAPPEISNIPGVLKFLMINGVEVDEIISLGTQPPLRFVNPDDPASRGRETQHTLDWTVEAITILRDRTQDPYATSEGAFWRTLIGDRLLSSEGTFRPAPAVYEGYLDALIKCQALKLITYEVVDHFEAGLAGHMQDTLIQSFGSPEGFSRADAQGSMFAAAMGPHSYRRTFACTKNGYIGLVPPGTKIGDVVCVLFGMQTPVILRKTNEVEVRLGNNIVHELVGECYMHGMMDGEMLAAGFEKKSFVLG